MTSLAPRSVTPHSAAAFRLIDRTLRQALPALGDFALVHLRRGKNLEGVAAAHARPDQTRSVRALMRARPLQISDPQSTVALVVRSGRPQLRTGILPPSPDDRSESSVLLRRLAPRSAVVVPIVVRGKVIGALSLCHSRVGRRYGAESVARAERLATQIGYVLLMGIERGVFMRSLQTGRARPALLLRRRPAAQA